MRILKAQISGRVQGVWFRASTQDYGNRLGLTGWVKNNPDGKVEVYAEGEKELLNKLLEWLHRGPKYARVSHVDYSFEEGTPRYQDFQIKY